MGIGGVQTCSSDRYVGIGPSRAVLCTQNGKIHSDRGHICLCTDPMGMGRGLLPRITAWLISLLFSIIVYILGNICKLFNVGMCDRQSICTAKKR